jgi:hypothetical protein
MKLLATAVRAGIVIAAVAVLSASSARAQEFSTTLQLGGNTYTLESFSWGPTAGSTGEGVSNELTFTLSPNIAGGLDFMNDAAAKQAFATADLQEQFTFGTPTPTTVVDIQMSDLKVKAVRVSADNNASTNPGAPRETVTLKFDSVVYTFQPYLPNGQKNGPPVSFSAQFKK